MYNNRQNKISVKENLSEKLGKQIPTQVFHYIPHENIQYFYFCTKNDVWWTNTFMYCYIHLVFQLKMKMEND